MKVLFLDIDGVVNNHTSFLKGPENHWPIDQYCAFLVGKIQLDTDCKVVLSSAWRNHPQGMAEVSRRVVPLFDKTCQSWYDKDTDHHSWRGEEIQKWLDAHPEVTRYAILDDESDMLESQMPHFFKTNFYTGGLTKEIADRVTMHFLCDDTTTHVTVATPEGWKCKQAGCEVDYLHCHSTFDV